METIVAVITVGTIIIVLTFAIGKVWDIADNHKNTQRRLHKAQSEPLFIAAANAASDLRPLVLHLNDLNGAVIQMFGADGSYITSENGRNLKQAICAWVKRGAKVKYLLAEPKADVSQQLLGVQARVGERNLEVLVPKQSMKLDAKTKQLLGKYRTLHPTLIFLPRGGQAMWVEGLHQRNSSVAYNVTYVSPEVMRTDSERRREFSRYNDDLSTISGHLIPLSASHRAIH